MSTLGLDVTTLRPRIGLRWSEVKQTVLEWRRRVRSRSELASLDEVGLQDIGVSRCSAEFEVSKPFWMP